MRDRNQGYARQDQDFYPTPSWVTEALLRRCTWVTAKVWVAAWLNGHILRV